MSKNNYSLTIPKVLFICTLMIIYLKTAILSEEPIVKEHDCSSQVSISVETKTGFNFTDKMLYGENESIVERQFSTVKVLSACVENLLCYNDGTITDELTVGASAGLLNFLSVYASCKLFIEKNDIGVGIDGKIIISHEFKTAGFNLENENEFLYDITGKKFVYVNNICSVKSFDIAENTSVGIILEHELTVSGSDFQNQLLVGPMYSVKFLSLYVNYAVGIKPCFTHGTEIGCVIDL